MNLKIKSIKIVNFKNFKELKFEPNNTFNVIIGENNAGKSTIFEAIQLWKRCYDLSIKADDKGFYKNKSGKNSRYLSYSDLYFLRLTNDKELFHSTSHTTVITITITSENREFNLGFEIIKPQTISNAYYKVRARKKSQFEEFANYLQENRIKLSKAIFLYQTRPVASVLSKEPFMNQGQITKKIEKGKSQEVLRNKIVTGRTEEQIKELKKSIEDIVNVDFNFDFINKSKKDVDEYINLKIKTNGKSLDLHLQGSGFLQVVEIFSTIKYVDAPLSILLVDEPDSHIHTTLQRSLIKRLKSVNEAQIFVISHNDNFVSEANEGELYYLNSTAKQEGLLKSLKIDEFDMVKKDLGGTILCLERISNCSKIVFVEGSDDEKYIKSLLKLYNKFSGQQFNDSHVVFFFQRGKDYLKQKIENVGRILFQIVRNKSVLIVYDRDFSTTDANSIFRNDLSKSISQNSECFSHDGYCFESVLFKNKKILSSFLHKATGEKITDIYKFIEEFENNISSELQNVRSNIYRDLNKCFKGQKKISRPELNKIDFSDFVQNCYIENALKVQLIMNKDQIKKFILEFNKKFCRKLFDLSENDKCEIYSSSLFNLYLNNISKINHICKDYQRLLNKIYA
jgi:AAA15 family ATPase/GTPase